MKNTFFIFILFLIKEIFADIKINDNYIEASFTNEIWIGEKKYRFLNFANYSDGTMIVEVSYANGNSKRIFFGLKPDGSYLFDKNSEGSYEITRNANNNTYRRTRMTTRRKLFYPPLASRWLELSAYSPP